MEIKNTATRYGLIAILFHWIMAIWVISLVVMGLYMVYGSHNAIHTMISGWHKEWGLLILAFITARLIWRLKNITPSLDFLPSIERLAARGAQWMFYILLFTMPISGWLMKSAEGRLPSFFGLFVMPPLLKPNEHLSEQLFTVHQWLSYTLIATFVLHVTGALKHQFINKDGILKRMWYPN